ncbi:Hypothetical protein BN2458_PEG1993 [Helicobacter typhlonius]|uniref:Uncharacterized protein n=1 Tax=Helicobacter typhlonius TaxID=76936 RepID=A0A0S4PXY4_9HELI|nr:Hypothetical protein BN2458_PEG1993 [Helicobacter typhlonius]
MHFGFIVSLKATPFTFCFFCKVPFDDSIFSHFRTNPISN